MFGGGGAGQRLFFEGEVGVAAGECPRDLGYEISDPPSEDVWVEGWDAGDSWLTHSELPDDMSPADWAEVKAKCPQPGFE